MTAVPKVLSFDEIVDLVNNNDRDGLKTAFEQDGFDVNMVDSNGNTALQHAVISEHIEILEILTSHPQININTRNSWLMTPLMSAAESGKSRALEFLLEKGADASCTDKYDRTALIIAAGFKEWKCVEILLKSEDCSPDAKDVEGMNALMHGIRKGSNEMVKTLIERTNLFQVDTFNYTALHHACESGSLEMVKLIVEKDILDINKKDIFGKTPLQIALHDSFLDIADYLIQNGANPIFQDLDGHPAYDYAAKFDDSETFLVKYEPAEPYLDGMFRLLIRFSRFKTIKAYAEKCAARMYPNGREILKRAMNFASRTDKAGSMRCLLIHITDKHSIIDLARETIISKSAKHFAPLYERFLELEHTDEGKKGITKDFFVAAVKAGNTYVGNYLLDQKANSNYFEDDHNIKSHVESLLKLNATADRIESPICIRIQPNSDQEVCFICREGYGEDDCAIALPCKHVFHQECYREWGKRHEQCPYCQKPVYSGKINMKRSFATFMQTTQI